MMLRSRRRGLSPQQLSRAEAIAEEWASCAVCTEPADRPAAERAIRELYRMHGFAAPTFVWVDSLLVGDAVTWLLGDGVAAERRFLPRGGNPTLREILACPRAEWRRFHSEIRKAALAAAAAALGEQLRMDLPPRSHLDLDAPSVALSYADFRTRLDSVPGASHLAAMRARVALRRPRPLTWWSIMDWRYEVERAGRLPLRFWEALRGAYHGQVPSPVRARLDESLGLRPSEAMDTDWHVNSLTREIGRYDLYRRLGLVRYPRPVDQLLDTHAAAARSCWRWNPYPRLCVLTERPARLTVEWPRPHLPRLHNPTGPAMVTRDGQRVYAWRGMVVCRRLIEGELTITDWLREPNVEIRRAIVERMGYEWLLANRDARRIAADEYGTLWWIRDPYSFAGIVVVEVVNSTPEPDGSFKRYFLRVPPDQTVPRDAIGWTFGLRPGEYGPATMT